MLLSSFLILVSILLLSHQFNVAFHFSISKITHRSSLFSSNKFQDDIPLLIDKTFDTVEDAYLHCKRIFLQESNLFVANKDNLPVLVVVGSGWGSHALLKIIETNLYRVICISPRPYFIFTPMLASTAVGTVEHRSIIEPIRSSNPLVEYIEGEMIDVDPINKSIIISNPFQSSSTTEITNKNNFISNNNKKLAQYTLAYDYLAMGVGATVADFGIPGVSTYCCYLKEIEDVRRIKSTILNNFEQASYPSTTIDQIKQLLTFVVVGGGPTGVEFSGELSDFIDEDLKRLYPKLIDYVQVVLINAGSSLLSTFDDLLRQKALAGLKEQKIKIVMNAKVVNVNEKSLEYTQKTNDNKSETVQLSFGLCVWAGGTASREITKTFIQKLHSKKQQEISCKIGNKLLVDKWLRVLIRDDMNDRNNFDDNLPVMGSIFSYGDCSYVIQNEDIIDHKNALPQTAQVAGQQGAYVARLLNRKYDLHATIPTYNNEKYRSSFPIKYFFLQILSNTDAKPFSFLNLGILAYIGSSSAVAQVQLGQSELFKSQGLQAFLLWRSVYLVKQVSTRNRFLVLVDQIKTKLFGRDLTGI
eukprot:gene6467-8896_t